MSRYSGQQPAGARAATAAVKRLAAEDRNARTPLERTAWYRQQRARIRAALAETKD